MTRLTAQSTNIAFNRTSLTIVASSSSSSVFQLTSQASQRETGKTSPGGGKNGWSAPLWSAESPEYRHRGATTAETGHGSGRIRSCLGCLRLDRGISEPLRDRYVGRGMENHGRGDHEGQQVKQMRRVLQARLENEKRVDHRGETFGAEPRGREALAPAESAPEKGGDEGEPTSGEQHQPDEDIVQSSELGEERRSNCSAEQKDGAELQRLGDALPEVLDAVPYPPTDR
jgi:hypothetical protein